MAERAKHVVVGLDQTCCLLISAETNETDRSPGSIEENCLGSQTMCAAWWQEM